MKKKQPAPMIPQARQTPQQPAQTATKASAVPLSVQNIRADERPLYAAIWSLHQRQPAPDAYLEALADLMRQHLTPAMYDVINRHININRKQLQAMHTVEAWRTLFRAVAEEWLTSEYIPDRIEKIASTLASYGDDYEAKAYSHARAAMLAVTWLSDMGMVDHLCGLALVVTSRHQAAMQESESA